MRSSSIRRRARSRSQVDKNSFWLSFSDLMSALVLVIILVLFYMLYQYFLMHDDYAEKRDAMVILQSTLAENEEDIASKEAALTAAQQALEDKNLQLSSAETELTAAQEDLAVQQLLLAAAQQAAQLTQEELDQQRLELQNTLSTLDDQQRQILSQQTQLQDQQGQIEQLVGLRTRIIASLSDALRSANISATVDPASGAIALESDVLFDTGKSDLKPEGRARIDAFLPVYLNVLFSDEYRDYVSEIIIEGHTDSVGGYITNLQLSQQRAFNVASYVLADEYPHVTPEVRAHLREIATANGRSYSNLIYDAGGAEIRDASRRVVFKFRLTDEQMVAQMQRILEHGGGDAATPAPAP